jgi:predicted nucleic acid-binding protein
MIETVALVDSDTLSELSRGHPHVTARARAYLHRHGRLTISAVTVFERLRGYRASLRDGKPFEAQLRQFEGLAACCMVLPVDSRVADRAAIFWAHLGTRGRRGIGDILIAATASANGMPLVTRNRKDFEPIARIAGADLTLLDWARLRP